MKNDEGGLTEAYLRVPDQLPNSNESLVGWLEPALDASARAGDSARTSGRLIHGVYAQICLSLRSLKTALQFHLRLHPVGKN